MTMAKRLEGKSAIITGATKGLGRGIASVFAGEGACVLIVGRDEASGAKVVEAIEKDGGTASFFQADVSNLEDLEAMAQAAVERFGGLDILCSNAGIFPSARLDQMTEQDWDTVNTVNLKGTVFAVKAAMPHMQKRGQGSIVLTSSITGPITGYPGWSHYGATKAGMLGFMRTAAIELAKHHITINAIMPGNIMTEGLDDIGDDYLRRMEEAIPMGKLGDPKDIGYAALFLASNEAKYITGQTLVVDGGQTLPESMDAMG
jgi:3-oxoacyl-[acyl-carrier protein] reductase